MSTLRVTALNVYPVKSLVGVEPQSAAVDERGLVGDRRWAVVAPDGTKVTAREEHRLLGVGAEPLDGGAVRLRAPGVEPVVAEPPLDGARVPVGFSGQSSALSGPAAASEWLSERVGRQLQLVWQDDRTIRPIRLDLGGQPGDRNSFADAAPIHLTSEASLRRLNDWVLETALERGEEPADPLRQERFRSNVVVDGDEPFEEDAWSVVRIGEVTFRATMLVDRCVMTTIDRVELRTTKEPIRTLARHRKWDGSTWFGIRLTPVLPLPAGSCLGVGDPVEPD